MELFLKPSIDSVTIFDTESKNLKECFFFFNGKLLFSKFLTLDKIEKMNVNNKDLDVKMPINFNL